MKKILSLMMVFLMAASLTACGNSRQEQQSSVESGCSSTAVESGQSSAQAENTLETTENGQSSPQSKNSPAASQQPSTQSKSSSAVLQSRPSSLQSRSNSSVSPQKRSATPNKSGSASPSSNPKSSSAGSSSQVRADNGNARVRFSFNNESIVVDMNDSPTSRDFLSQLPLTLTFKDYSGSEKIAYPPKELSTQGAPAGSDPSIGDLALFAPWGDIVLYYGDAGYYEGIVKMGHVESGIEKLANMKGDFTVKIERIN